MPDLRPTKLDRPVNSPVDPLAGPLVDPSDGLGIQASTKDRFAISELAEEFQVTARAIRFYEDKGLLNPARNGRTRIYSRGDRVRLALILRGKRLGFSLSEIREVLDAYYHVEGQAGQLRFNLSRSQQQLQKLRAQRRDIEQAISELEDICALFERQLKNV